MSTITWKVNTLSRTLSTGRVDSVHYAVDARSDDEVYSAGAYGELALEGDVTTAYADLDEATVVGWVKSALGEDKVAENQCCFRGTADRASHSNHWNGCALVVIAVPIAKPIGTTSTAT